MEITFNDLRSREIINIYDGKRLGRAIDIVFDKESSVVLGLTVPGQSKLFRKKDDIFIPMNKITKIGDDVMLVTLTPNDSITYEQSLIKNGENRAKNAEISYIRFRRPTKPLK